MRRSTFHCYAVSHYILRGLSNCDLQISLSDAQSPGLGYLDSLITSFHRRSNPDLQIFGFCYAVYLALLSRQPCSPYYGCCKGYLQTSHLHVTVYLPSRHRDMCFLMRSGCDQQIFRLYCVEYLAWLYRPPHHLPP